MRAVLWHFQFSHYNEKARWALDWKRLPHERRPVVPGLHVPTMLAVSGQRRVPVVQLDDRVIPDSTAIIAALEAAIPTPRLYPAAPAERAQALAIEEECDEILGPAVRRLVYHAILPDPAWCIRLMSEPLDPAGLAQFEAMFPMVEQVIRAEMGIDDAGAAQSGADLARMLDRLATLRSDRPYLVGEAFSVADLTAAALLSPLLAPPEFPYPDPQPSPIALRALRAGLVPHPTCAWAATIYRQHRGRSAEQALTTA
jgi:glutathione S-transferase